jgi:hypothetical protein
MLAETQRTDRSIPTVAETEQIADRRNFPFEFKSANLWPIAETALDGATKEFAVIDQRVTITKNNRVGVRGVGAG